MPEAPPPGSPGESRRRLMILAGLVGLLVAGGLVDRVGVSAGQAGAALPPVPIAAPAAALSSSWFCAGATDQPSGAAPGAVVVANQNAYSVQADIELVTSTGGSSEQTVTVAPRSRQVVTEQVPGGAPWIGASVDVDSGGVAVAQETISAPLGQSATPCATTGSAQWYFPSGATYVNEDVYLSLLNPYPTDSVVDLTFSTDEGIEQPGDFQGIDVPPHGLTVVDLGSHLRRRQQIATSVVARTGRMVAWETDVVSRPTAGEPIVGTAAANAPDADPAVGVAGVTNLLGAAATATSWAWPDGISGSGVDEQYLIYDPGPTPADVQLSLQLAAGSAAPFALTVAPGQVSVIDSGQQARIPSGVAHSALLTSTNGVGVVAERVLSASSPANRTGRGGLLGGRLAARSWLLAPGSASPSLDEYVVLLNPGRTPASVAIAELDGGALAAVPGLDSVAVGAGQRVAVRINDHVSHLDVALLVTSTAAVYVEQDLYGSGTTPGISLGFGVPLS